jgi:hypothetical protein
MNERIKELVEQARIKDHWSIDDGRYLTNYLDEQKFAELIVKECVGIVDKIVPPGYNDYPDYRDQIEQAFRRECATEIKKHFGVEE